MRMIRTLKDAGGVIAAYVSGNKRDGYAVHRQPVAKNRTTVNTGRTYSRRELEALARIVGVTTGPLTWDGFWKPAIRRAIRDAKADAKADQRVANIKAGKITQGPALLSARFRLH